jgi:hypothetical protein
VAVWDFAQQKMMAMQECEPFEFNSPIVFSREGSVIAIGTPNFGVSFFSLDAATSCSSGQPVYEFTTNLFAKYTQVSSLGSILQDSNCFHTRQNLHQF